MRAQQEHDYVEYVRANLPRLHAVAYRVLGDSHRADDAVQNALLALYRRWPRIHEVERLDAYAYAMVVNACLADGRRLWSRVLLRPVTPEAAISSGSGQSDSSRVDDRLLVRQALHRLPEPQRVVVILRFLCDLSVSDVAEILNRSEGTVKSRTSYALKALRGALDAPGADRLEDRPVSDESLRPLLTENVPPTRLRAEQILSTARARQRLRHGGAAAAVGVLAATVVITTVVAARPDPARPVVAAPPPAAPTQCTAAKLPTVTRSGLVTAMDPGGRYVVGIDGEAFVLWVDGRSVPVPGGADFGARAVNADGSIAGSFRPEHRAAVYRDGTISQLRQPAGATSSVGFAINARGDVAGTAEFPGGARKAVRWPAGDGEPQVLPAASTQNSARDIADDGTVVGDSGGVPYLWDAAGNGRPVPVPDGQDGGFVNAVSDSWMVGVTDIGATASSTPKAALWDRHTQAVTELPGFQPRAVSAAGVVAGKVDDAGGQAALWAAGRVVTLPRTDPAGPTGGEASVINAAGTVAAGLTHDAKGGTILTIWRCR